VDEPTFEDAQRAAAADLPELLRATRGAADPAANKAFWAAYFRLPAWITIARGTTEAPAPFVVVADERPTLLVFSSAEAAAATGRAAGLPEEEARRLLAVPMPAAADWVASLAAHGIRAVQFEAHLGGGIVAPIENLPRMRADLLGPAESGERA
jgi:hypothetical protein